MRSRKNSFFVGIAELNMTKVLRSIFPKIRYWQIIQVRSIN